MAKRFSAPNIILIMADQLAPQFLPCYGHPVVRAPTLARLGDEGVVFDAAYTNSPLCAPSRFVMMSGRLPAAIRAWDNAAEFSSEIPTFAHYLARLGYHTCLSGKMHFVGADQLHGFGERLTTDVYPSDFTWHPRWDLPKQRLDWYHNMEVVVRAGPCIRSMYLDYDDEALFHARRYVFTRAREADDAPFLLVLSLIQPHDPYLCRREHWDLYREENIDLPRVSRENIAEDPHSRRLRQGYGADEIDLDETTLRRARRAYYGSISDIDDKVAALLRTVEEAGLSDNTVIVFTSDHGDMLGERGMWFKMSFLEHSARVPLMLHAPGMFAPRRVGEAVSLADILPSLVELARDGRPGDYVGDLDGRSFLSHAGGTGGHDEVIGEYYAECTQSPIFMIRRGKEKFIHADGDPPQLYDLEKDPDERANLASGHGVEGKVASFLEELQTRYNSDSLKALVLESQQRRALLKGIFRKQGISWDYLPPQHVSQAYVRSHLPIYDLERKARFPG